MIYSQLIVNYMIIVALLSITMLIILTYRKFKNFNEHVKIVNIINNCNILSHDLLHYLQSEYIYLFFQVLSFILRENVSKSFLLTF